MNTKETESEEIDRLINRGVDFTIQYKKAIRTRGWRKLFKKPEVETVTETFKVKEPTLAVLDHLSRFWVDIDIDREAIAKGGTETIAAAKRMAHDNARKMARVVAVAVLGEDYYKPETSLLGVTRYKEDTEKLEELETIFLHSITPSDLLNLVQIISACANLGNFMSSMALMSASRTTATTKVIESEA